MTHVLVFLILLLGSSAGASGKEKTIKLPDDNSMAQLKPGEGVEVVRAGCIACHSTDYIVRQPGRDAQQWETEVKKMITVFGAPISESDAKVMVKYLAATYGPAANQATRKRKPLAH